jgi:hypothetical protein
MEEAVPILSLYLHPTFLYLYIQNIVDDAEGLGPYGYPEESGPQVAEDLSVFHGTFQEVVHLKLAIKYDTFEEGAELLATFPLLETLNLQHDWYPSPWGKAQISYDTMFLSSHVWRISTCYGGYGMFFMWLLDQPQPPQVSTLILDSNPITKSLSLYIQSLGTSLEHFSFYPNFPGNLDMIRIGQQSVRGCVSHRITSILRTILRSAA